MDKFDKAVEDGIIYKVVTTNLTYLTDEVLNKPYFIKCDMSKYIAYIIDTLNHECSISELLNPYGRIEKLINRYKNGEY
jgi:ribose-phosphate pyrophosphokinase